MNKPFIIKLCLILLSGIHAYQTFAQKMNNQSGKIKAIIVGVSNYKNLETENQLKYADKDAQGFYNFLTNLKGVNTEDIDTFYNTYASKERILGRLQDVLEDNTSPDGIKIFYFAGHAFVDYLLFHNGRTDGDSTQNDAISLSDIKKFIDKSKLKNQKIILVTDACKPNTEITNIQANTDLENFIKSCDNIFKISACKPSESAIEDVTWGTGHGVFTFYFLKGLKGLADINNDSKIEFGELQKYVSENVTSDTKNTQTPVFEGDSSDVLFHVNIDENDLKYEKNEIELAKKNCKATPNQGGKRGLNITEKQTKTLLDSFKLAIKRNYLISPKYYEEDFGDKIKILPEKQTLIPKGCPVMFTPNDSFIVSVINDESIAISQVRNMGKILRTYKVESKPSSLTFSKDSKFLFFLTRKKNRNVIGKIDFSQKKIVTYSECFPKILKELIYYENDSVLLAFNQSNDIVFIDPVTFKTMNTIKIKQKIKSIYLNYKKKELWVLLTTDDIEKIDLQKRTEGKSFSIRNVKYINHISFSENGNRGYVETNNKYCYIIDTNTFIKHSDSIKIQTSVCPGILSLKNDLFVLSPTFTSYNDFKLDNFKQMVDTFYLEQQILAFHANKNFSKLYTVHLNQANSYSINTYQLKLPILKKSAFTYCNKILNDTSLKKVHSRVQIDLYSKIIDKITPIIDNCLYENNPKISYDVTEENVRILDSAFTIYADTTKYGKDIRIKQNILKACYILYNNKYDDFDLARYYLKKIQILEPAASYPSLLLSYSYKKQNDLPKAAKYADEAVRIAPKWSNTRNQYGYILKDIGKYGDAIEQFKKVLDIRSNNINAYMGQADTYVSLGAFKNAELNLKKILKIDTANTHAYNTFATLEIKRGNFDNAKQYLDRAQSLDSSNVESLIAKAQFNVFQYFKIQREPDLLYRAQAYLKQANTENPENPLVYIELSKFYVEIYKQLELERDFKNIVYNICNFNSKEDVPVETMKAKLLNMIIEKNKLARKFDKYNTEVNIGLGFADFKGRNSSLMESDFKEIIKQDTTCARNYYNLGQYYNLIDKQDLAISQHNKALIQDKQFLPSYIALMDIYKKQNKLIELKQLLNKAKKLFPNSPIFFNELAILDKNIKDAKEAIRLDENYRWAEIYTENYAFLNGKKVNDGKLILDLKRFEKFKDNYIKVKKNNKFGIMDISGNMIISASFDSIYPLDNNTIAGVFIDENRQRLQFFDYSGIMKFNALYTQIHKPNYGFVPVQLSGKWGCVNSLGNTIVDCLYDGLEATENGLIYWNTYNSTDIYGCANTLGKEVLKVEYEKILPAKVTTAKSNASAWKAQKNGKAHYYDSAGNMIE